MDMSANGPHSLGGFSGKAPKGKHKWVQKGGNRPSKNSGKSSSSVSGPIAIVMWTIVAFVVAVVLSIVAFLARGYGLI